MRLRKFTFGAAVAVVAGSLFAPPAVAGPAMPDSTISRSSTDGVQVVVAG